MMKKIILSIFLLLFILPLMGSQGYVRNFFATAVDVNDNITVVDGGAITSSKISIGGQNDRGAITVWFTPAAAATVSVDFEFAVSTDQGSTWSTGIAADAYLRIQANTDVNSISSVVRITTQVQFYGATHVKLYRIKVNSGAGNCTAINARLSMARRLR
jgi:hypothetical protein